MSISEKLEDYNTKVQTFRDDFRGLNHYVMDHTFKLCTEDADLIETISLSVKDQRVVYQSEKLDVPFDGPSKNIIISKKRTLEAAEKYKGKKIAVLNFANNHSIGGAPWSAGAQEESLCRCSSLYPCLKAAESSFYQKHRDAFSNGYLDNCGNDDLIYTPHVKVIKTDESAPRLKEKQDWFTVDVITSAAPENRAHVVDHRMARLLYERLKRVFEMAKLNSIDVLILGAYGCGAFGNSPKMVARVFKQLIKDYSFETVEFAVYCNIYDEKSNYAVFNNIICSDKPYPALLELYMKYGNNNGMDLSVESFKQELQAILEYYYNICMFREAESLERYLKDLDEKELNPIVYYELFDMNVFERLGIDLKKEIL